MHVHIEDIPHVARALVAYAKSMAPRKGATVICLSGDLGAGKTTLVQHIARELGVANLVPSPTFVILRRYKTTDEDFTTLAHIDAYRIESNRELKPLHLETLFADPHTLVCIEWPEKLGGALPSDCIQLSLTVISESERELTLQGDLEALIQGALQKVSKVV